MKPNPQPLKPFTDEILESDEFIVGVPDNIGSSCSRSRAGKKAKRKGGTFERKIAKYLSEFWGASFHRTPASGGSPLKGDFNMAGDLCTSDEDWLFHVECKNQEALAGFHTILTSKKSAVWKWWEQASSECPEGQIPLLVFTKNRIPEFCMFPNYFWDCVEWNSDESLESTAHVRVGDVSVVTLKRFLGMGRETCFKAMKMALKKKTAK